MTLRTPPKPQQKISGLPTGAIVGTTDTQTLSGKTLVSPVLQGAIVDHFSNGANTISIPPAAPCTLATTSLAETLTNKTLDIQANTLKNGGAALTPATGSGAMVLANQPTLSAPIVDKLNNGAADLLLPSGPTTLASTSTAQTLTNKTLTSPAIIGGTISGAAITNLTDPSNAQDVATKAYVDAHATGFSPKGAAACATTANITLSGEQTIDGVTTSASVVLVKNQSTPAQNGLYVSGSGAWTRTADMNAWAAVPGAFTFVTGGTANGKTGWTCTSAAGGTLGTTAITWTQFSAAGTYTAGTGLSLSGSQFSIDGTVATLSGSQTLTNKSLTSPIIDQISNGAAVLALPSGPTTLASTSTAQTLTNKTLNQPTINIHGGVFTLQDDSDPTKQARFAMAGITTGTTRSYSLPNGSGTLVCESTFQELSNKIIDNTNSATLIDANFLLQDNGDATKIAGFDLSGITTGHTRTIGLPDKNTTLVGIDTTDTLTNKTLNQPVLNSPVIDQISNGANIITLPPAPSTLATTATGQTFTSKTFDTASNTFKVNGRAIASIIDASFGICLQSNNIASTATPATAGRLFHSSNAEGGDGAVLVDTGSAYRYPGQPGLTRLVNDTNSSFTPLVSGRLIRDTAALTNDRKLTLSTTNVTDGFEVILSRRGSSGGHNRGVYQADGTTLIVNVPDNTKMTFGYDATAALWFQE